MRFEDWPERLDAAIEAARGAAFSWGAHDCALFALGVAQALTGTDYGKPWRGEYASEAEAAQILTAGGGLEAMASALFGPPVAPAFAQRGDVVLFEQPGGPALGVCLGVNSAFVTAPRGLVFVPTARCAVAWRV